MDDLERLYENVHSFTPECLDSLCEILDASGGWEHLADLLDLKHLLRSTDLFERRPTRTLLEFAIVRNTNKKENNKCNHLSLHLLH